MSERTGEFVTFILGEQTFAFDIRFIREVNPQVRITPVPRSAPHIRGLVNIRGQIILILDIAVIFGNPPRPAAPDSHIVIIKTSQEIARTRHADAEVNPARFGDKPVGFLVDSPGEVVRIPGSALEPPPPHLAEADARFFSGVARSSGRLLSVLNVEELITYGFNPVAADASTPAAP